MTEEAETAHIERVRNALLTPAAICAWVGDSSTSARERRFRWRRPQSPIPPSQYALTGAAYARGRLVPTSQRDPFPDVRPTDPPVVRQPDGPINRLRGTWLYGGHWMGQFGHFLLESLTTLWPEATDSYAGVVFHRWPPEPPDVSHHGWQERLVERAGWTVPVHIIGNTHTTVEDLRIPTRAYRLHRGALPEAVRVWERIALTGAPERPVFLSRSRLEHDERRIPGSEQLDQQLASLGCEVVHPQELSIDDQLAVVSRATTLVGVSGSQLHLSVFAAPGTKVIEIGDPRLPNTPVHDQVLMVEAKRQTHYFVPLLLSSGGRRDAESTARRVAAIGL